MYLVFVHRSMSESSLVRALVEDHRVLHVVARVRNHSYDGVGPLWILIHLELPVPPRLHQRRLWGLDFVHFVVGALVNAVHRRSHCLFAHLALVHDAGSLVVVAKGSQGGDEGKHVRGVELLMGGGVQLGLVLHLARLWPYILWKASNLHVDLLQGPDELLALCG